MREASQSEDNVVEMEKEVVGPPRLEILNSLSVPFFSWEGRQLAWGRVLGCGGSRGSFFTDSLVL